MMFPYSIWKSPMQDNISYNQLISFRSSSVKCQAFRGAYVSEGKFVIVFGNNKKFDIDGKYIEVTVQKPLTPYIV